MAKRKRVDDDMDGLKSDQDTNTTVLSTEILQLTDQFYFNAYSDVSIHEEMLRDTVRTGTYRDAIFKFSDMIQGKVVADIGAGTGILSIFCIQAGAKKVYALEASDIAEHAKAVISSNGMAEQIEVIHCRVEDCDLPEKVDLVVSEWMGYMLLYESMWRSLLYARDKWLKPNGTMLPSVAEIYLAPITDEDAWEEKAEFWESVKGLYGVNMLSMVPYAWKCMCKFVRVTTLQAENILSQSQSIGKFDINAVMMSELEQVKSDFSFVSMGHGTLHGFSVWFSVKFDPPRDSTEMKAVILSTSPYDKPTHWQQCALYVQHPVTVDQDDKISGSIEITTNKKYSRFLDVQLSYKVKDGPTLSHQYEMNEFS